MFPTFRCDCRNALSRMAFRLIPYNPCRASGAGNAGFAGNYSYNVWKLSEANKYRWVKDTPQLPASPASRRARRSGLSPAMPCCVSVCGGSFLARLHAGNSHPDGGVGSEGSA